MISTEASRSALPRMSKTLVKITGFKEKVGSKVQYLGLGRHLSDESTSHGIMRSRDLMPRTHVKGGWT